ncbi:MAG: putative glycolipid-binding domain-containing protein [Ardenticatenaceae bacterium]
MTRTAPLRRDRHVVWQSWEALTIEHLQLREEPDRVVADGLIVGLIEGHVLRLQYTLQCDTAYKFQMCHLHMTQPWRRTLDLSLDHDGVWSVVPGSAATSLTGSSEIDLSASPFTNTLPIRRLGLGVKQAAEIQVAYISVPELSVRADHQRYTLLRETNEYQLYRFESPASDFTADIRVDPDGLVLDYPGLFRRVWPRQT